MKKLILSLVTAITISSNLRTEGINLKLKQKPKLVSTYEWCKNRANDMVEEARQAIKAIFDGEENTKILNFLNQIRPTIETTNYSNPNYLEETKAIETHFCVKALPEKINNLIIKLLEKPSVKKELNITKILKNSDGVLIAERNGGPAIKFVQAQPQQNMPEPEKNMPLIQTFSFEFCVAITTKFLSQIKNYNYEKSIGPILHELGHIIHLHIKENRAIISNIDVNIENHQDLYNNLSKAQEIQADITGIFNMPDVALNQHILFKDVLKFLISENISQLDYNAPEYPTIEERIKYFSEIYESMLKDTKLPAEPIKKEIKIQAPVKKQQVITKKEPVKTQTVIKQNNNTGTQKISKVSEQKNILTKQTLENLPKKAIKPQAPANTKPVTLKPQTLANNPKVPANKPVILKKQAPVNSQVNMHNSTGTNTDTQKITKVSEIAKKFEKLTQDLKKK